MLLRVDCEFRHFDFIQWLFADHRCLVNLNWRWSSLVSWACALWRALLTLSTLNWSQRNVWTMLIWRVRLVVVMSVSAWFSFRSIGCANLVRFDLIDLGFWGFASSILGSFFIVIFPVFLFAFLDFVLNQLQFLCDDFVLILLLVGDRRQTIRRNVRLRQWLINFLG